MQTINCIRGRDELEEEKEGEGDGGEKTPDRISKRRKITDDRTKVCNFSIYMYCVYVCRYIYICITP